MWGSGQIGYSLIADRIWSEFLMQIDYMVKLDIVKKRYKTKSGHKWYSEFLPEYLALLNILLKTERLKMELQEIFSACL